MCEHEFESLRTADGSFCMTACRKCMKSTGEIETLAKAESLLAAANAELAAAVKKVEDFYLVVVILPGVYLQKKHYKIRQNFVPAAAV